MEMTKILARIEARLKDLGLTAGQVSRQATGSPDTIRNWKRRVAKGESPGASTATLQPVANALRVPLDWLLGNGPDDLQDYLGTKEGKRALLIEAFDGLDADLQSAAVRQIVALKPPSA
jgi:transcriptional regulator with XRE-family HTH domain